MPCLPPTARSERESGLTQLGVGHFSSSRLVEPVGRLPRRSSISVQIICEDIGLFLCAIERPQIPAKVRRGSALRTSREGYHQADAVSRMHVWCGERAQ